MPLEVAPRTPKKDTEKYVALGPRIRIHIDKWDGQPDEAMDRLVRALDPDKCKELGIEVRSA